MVQELVHHTQVDTSSSLGGLRGAVDRLVAHRLLQQEQPREEVDDAWP